MQLLLHVDPLYSLSGFVVGFLVGLTGVGGGALMTPLLVLVFGIHPYKAVGTDLLYASVTKLAGAGVHASRGTVEWRVVARLAAGSIPAAALTLFVLAHAKTQGAAVDRLITEVLGFALIATATALFFRSLILRKLGERLGGLSQGATNVLTVGLGALIGVVVSISSVGAGAIGLTALLILYPKLPIARLVGSDIAHAVPLTLIAGLGHWAAGGIDASLLASLVVGSIPGIVIGSFTASRVPDPVLRPILATTLAVVGGKLVF